MSELSYSVVEETVRVGLNGFGRIGRSVLRAALSDDDVEIVAINDVMDDDDMAYLLEYDSVYGRLEDVSQDGDTLSVGDREIDLLSERDPTALPWDELDVDVAFEATGLFRTHDEAAKHLEAGAEKVVISAPPKGEKTVPMFVYGVNHEEYDGADVVSNASCTTNSIAPVVKVLEEEFGIESGLLTTVHAYTGSQDLIDGPSSKRRRGRAAAENIVPTTTGAAVATTEVLPELEGKLDGMAIRVPVPNGSITDLTVDLESDVTKADLEAAIREAADGDLAGVLGYTDDEIVSRDVVGLPFSSYVDLEGSMVLEDGLVKVLAWYDNEYGFSERMLDLATYVVSESEDVESDADEAVVR
ncbi:type I glyceraldehyde-3-phosphate dehydrogenase [Natronobacterium gregoryi]|uniref:glyceraldehyde-3-phosphate dehydrogenase (NAD(P)(+)) (phosphorylating) n=2 Tax=Natronobacterium gregoryi TaxID=44930 RepID=L0AI62_NATGS|nr:type I glyceraldehyde-3-phosphate dehydrogenase [Natronobacterium gregoryi]AFZ72862.1 glyceraldehyde-3-phosphate dehydrogenase, type I [Natronobacterium gregoryi SP2]ELY69648.1 glyceraldehyde-3-phosphate dehydrogenase, type I [Natronobacterium gregoryi SP2]PLK21909.1 type I glyceraldehyde-3-phosphate dehydrogenase [Natronobacterium gregoryi SP2]SFI65950.1 glyceraldehyde-3-phosphate dehydrogenase (NAD+) [Natronobacterium gregoryi]